MSWFLFFFILIWSLYTISWSCKYLIIYLHERWILSALCHDGNGLQLQLSGTMLWRCHDFFETILSFFYRRHSTPFAVLRRSSNSFLIHSDLIRHVSSRRIFLFVFAFIWIENKYIFVSEKGNILVKIERIIK